MIDGDIDKLIEAGRRIAEALHARGDHADAEIVRRLCRSRSSAREGNRRLYRGNMDLRRRIDGAGDK